MYSVVGRSGMMEVKYPKIKVKLVGKDGNAFAIMGRVTKALRSAGVSDEEIGAFRTEATAAASG